MAMTENDKASRFPDAELKARAAWHYYVEGLTQERISEILGIGRIKVHRILSAAREEGVVQHQAFDDAIADAELDDALLT
ncbi:MAG: sugar-binding transcriptional regulator, partial [Mesorhizobium sp.]